MDAIPSCEQLNPVCAGACRGAEPGPCPPDFQASTGQAFRSIADACNDCGKASDSRGDLGRGMGQQGQAVEPPVSSCTENGGFELSSPGA